MPDFVRVKIAATQGSAPREAGAEMFVESDATFGTIGGGALEFNAISTARRMLNGDEDAPCQTVSLGPEIGQCCGGKVTLEFERLSNIHLCSDAEPFPEALIFGGGHVGKAIAASLSLGPISVSVVETRPKYLEGLPEDVSKQVQAVPEAAVRSANPGSAFIAVTHDHSLDFLVVEEALKRGDAAYVGMIGSKTKRAVAESRLRAVGVDPGGLVCPIGAAGLGDKRPEVIAAFVVAELLAAFRVPA